MRIVITICIIFLSAAVAFIVTAVIALEEELKEEERELFNNEMQKECYKRCTNGKCPKDCNFCAWGDRK